MWHYEQACGAHGVRVAQVLLTQEDVSHRERYLNARNTLMTLLGFRVLPVINENDTVAVEEIKVGDNDNLAALVAALIDADLLVLLSDIDGLYTGDPRHDPEARRIARVKTITPRDGGAGGRRRPDGDRRHGDEAPGGAEGHGRRDPHGHRRRPPTRRVRAVMRGEPVGTYFEPRTDRLAARKRWIAFALPVQGAIAVDAGARRALVERGKSLLPSGVLAVSGQFAAGDAVGVHDADGREFARGIVSCDARELELLRGAKTADIERLLGYRVTDEVIHRDNLVIL